MTSRRSLTLVSVQTIERFGPEQMRSKNVSKPLIPIFQLVFFSSFFSISQFNYFLLIFSSLCIRFICSLYDSMSHKFFQNMGFFPSPLNIYMQQYFTFDYNGIVMKLYDSKYFFSLCLNLNVFKLLFTHYDEMSHKFNNIIFFCLLN